MQFNYFRFLLVSLSSFLPFFAYICRLNLSMTIEQMVVPQECDLLPAAIVETQRPDCRQERAGLILEDHTLARMSRHQLSFRRGLPSRRRNGTHTKQNGWPLTIEFDTQLAEPKTKIPDNGSDVETKPISESVDDNLLNWSVEARNDLLGAFFIGYLISQVPGARAAEIFGAKPHGGKLSLFVASGLGCALSSLLFPLAARWSDGILYVYIIRVLLGISQGAMFPASYVLICEWLPRMERSAWLPVPSANGRLGTIAMNLAVPLVMESYGWEMVYYLSGFLTLLWVALFLVIGANSPAESSWLSKAEQIYIESRMDPRVGTPAVGRRQTKGQGAKERADEPKASGPSLESLEANERPASQAVNSINWLKMAANRPMIILSLAMFLSEWSNMLLLVKLPGFLGPVLRMDLVEIGFWSSVLVSVYCIHFPLSGYLAAKLEATGVACLSSLRIRKLFELLAIIFQAAGCLMIAYSEEKSFVLVALFFMMFGRATVGGGQCLMPPELSKEYPGSVFAFANTLANSAGVLGPMAVNWLVSDPREHQSWQNLWFTSAAIFIVGGLIFVLAADNRPQNYSKKPKAPLATSQLQLTLEPADEIFTMGSFSRLSSEPDPKLDDGSKFRNKDKLK